MTALVVFVEEERAQIVVRALLDRLLPGQKAIVLKHEGKSDLRKSYPRKIQAWRYPADVPFVVLHDNDGANCGRLKAELIGGVPATRRDRTKVRIVMQCLESWYLGDPDALVAAELIKDSAVAGIFSAAKFRNPDQLANAKQEFQRLHSERGQLAIARLLSPHMNLDRNRSRSFSHFVSIVRSLCPCDP